MFYKIIFDNTYGSHWQFADTLCKPIQPPAQKPRFAALCKPIYAALCKLKRRLVVGIRPLLKMPILRLFMRLCAF